MEIRVQTVSVPNPKRTAKTMRSCLFVPSGGDGRVCLEKATTTTTIHLSPRGSIWANAPPSRAARQTSTTQVVGFVSQAQEDCSEPGPVPVLHACCPPRSPELSGGVGGRASESTKTEHGRVDSDGATLGSSGVDKTSDRSGVV